MCNTYLHVMSRLMMLKHSMYMYVVCGSDTWAHMCKVPCMCSFKVSSNY